jgi:hypothetical protein
MVSAGMVSLFADETAKDNFKQAGSDVKYAKNAGASRKKDQSAP